MASIIRENRNGRAMYRVQFFDRDNKRRSIRLGDVNRKDAEAIAVRINSLISHSIAGTPPDKATAEWLSEIGQDLADKLANAGLIGKRETATLAAFLNGYIESNRSRSQIADASFSWIWYCRAMDGKDRRIREKDREILELKLL
ncbi:MAG: hypothetical protein IT427_01990, partial [Pirellulales bacterium]|nr:hypothetical protein [Pirellulales bacterium]